MVDVAVQLYTEDVQPQVRLQDFRPLTKHANQKAQKRRNPPRCVEQARTPVTTTGAPRTTVENTKRIRTSSGTLVRECSVFPANTKLKSPEISHDGHSALHALASNETRIFSLGVSTPKHKKKMEKSCTSKKVKKKTMPKKKGGSRENRPRETNTNTVSNNTALSLLLRGV